MNEPTKSLGQVTVPAICPRCGAALEPGATFCMECGLQVMGQVGFVPHPHANHGTCPACGAPLEIDADFCDQCGTPVKKSPVIEVARSRLPVQSTTANAGTCSACGASLEPGAAFCDQCGQPVQTTLSAPPLATSSPLMPVPESMSVVGPEPIPEPTPPQSWSDPTPQPISEPSMGESKERVCPRCGTAVSVENKFCDSCGLDLSVSYAAGTDEKSSANHTHPHRDDQPVTVTPTIILEADDGADGRLKDEVSANVRSQLIILSRQEARTGCIKEVIVDGKPIKVPIPAGVHDGSTVNISGRGYVDEETGARGPLRLSVFIG